MLDITTVALLGWLAIASLVLIGAIVPCCVVCVHILAWHSGWSALAGRYRRYEGTPGGTRYAKQTLKVGSVRWRRCVDVVVSDSGLYLEARAPFYRVRPVLIPWSDLVWAGDTRLYGRPAVRVEVAGVRDVPIVLYARLAHELVAHLPLPEAG